MISNAFADCWLAGRSLLDADSTFVSSTKLRKSPSRPASALSALQTPSCLSEITTSFLHSYVFERRARIFDSRRFISQVRNPDARKGGLDVSLFKRLATAHPDAVVQLTQQYRMNDDIMQLSNKLVYQDRMHVGSIEVADRRLSLPRPQGLDELGLKGGARCWVSDLLDPQSVVLSTWSNREILIHASDALSYSSIPILSRRGKSSLAR